MAIAAVGTLAGAVLWWRLPRGLTGTPLSLRQRVAGAMRPGVLPMLLTTLMTLTGAFAVFSYIAPLAMQGTGLSEFALPAVLLAFGIGAVIGNIAGGQAADRFGATRTVCWSLALSAAVLFGFSAIPSLPHAFAGPVLILAMVPWGVVGWAFPPAQASRILAIAPDDAPVVLSLNGSALYLGVALGSVVGAEVLRAGSPADLGWVAALFPLIGLAILLAAAAHGNRSAAIAPAE
jgi:predicted MFS family arabinose efflux permease